MKQTYPLGSNRSKALEAVQQAPEGWVMELLPNKRSVEQNRYLWALLNDVATQKTWCGMKMDAEDWKHLFTAALSGQRMTQGLHGGIVALGVSTSKMTKDQMSELIESIIAWGIENGVRFTDEQ